MVPSFRIPFLLNLLPSYVPGESIDCFHPVFVDGVRLRPALRSDSALSTAPLQSASCGTLFFGASWFAHLVQPAELLASLADRTNVAISLQRLLLPSFRSSRSPSSPSDITTVASGYLHRQDFHLLERPLASLHQRKLGAKQNRFDGHVTSRRCQSFGAKRVREREPSPNERYARPE